MANEVTTKSNSYLTSSSAYAEMFAAEAQRVGSGSGGGHLFLKFDGNTGEYSYGSTNDELPLGTLLAMNITSYKRGWINWNDGQVMEQIMVGLEDGPPPAKNTLPDHGPYVEQNDGWSEQMTIEMQMIDEPFTNLLVQANNESKRRAFKAMMNDFMKGFKLHEGCVPIIELDEVAFEGKAKEGKRKYRKHAPIFKIVDWKPEEELAALMEGTKDDYESEEDEAPRTERVASSRRSDPVVEEDERPRRTARQVAESNAADEDERPATTRRRPSF